MNYTLQQLEQNTITPNVFVYQPKESLTTWGIFLSSIILSSTALITQVLAQIQKSKCKEINCIGSNCVRDIEGG
jgi:hypothetical protein